jgi:hypothetical protein
MTSDLEHELRATFNELGDEARQADLAAPALRMGRRIRVRRTALAVGAATIAAAAVVLPFGAFAALSSTDRSIGPPDAGAPSTAPASSTPPPAPSDRPTPAVTAGPVDLPGGWLVASAPGASGTWVYDRGRRAYRQIQYRNVVPAPLGDLVAVQRSSDRRVGLLNLRNSQVRWVSGPVNVVGRANWSPDGRRLVYPGEGTAEGTLRLVVVDAATAQATTLPTNIECYENCAPYWLPNGTDIAMPLLPGPQQGLRVYSSVDGSVQPRITVAGVAGSGHAWSPDGRYVVVQAASGGGSGTHVVEVTTGRQVGQLFNVHPNAVYWASADRLLAIAEDAVLVLALNGDLVDRFPLPDEFAPDELPQTVLARQS